MVTISNEKRTSETPQGAAIVQKSLSTIMSSTEPSKHLLIQNKFVTHHAKSGLNPLADAAAYLFSIGGKLKFTKAYRHVNQLRKDLIQEINTFQDTAKAQGYSPEYILVSRYAICATLDDIIINTAWGVQGQWENQTLLSAFNQETINQERFFVILERVVKDPALYIDVMEFMYICLSLGFKGHYRSTEFNNNQLEQITNSLYKRIRAYRGDFSKSLSPFPVKPNTSQKSRAKHLPAWLVILLAAGVSLALFAGIRYMLSATSHQVYQDLTRMGNIASYETHDKTTE